MRVCLDTNVWLRLFGRTDSLREIRQALMEGRLELALSTAVLLEYEEVVARLSGAARWKLMEEFLRTLAQRHGNIAWVEPQYRFRIITADPDDNKFVDCAVAADADYVVTDDHDFAPLVTAGYRPKPITPVEFIAQHLQPA